MKRWVLFIFLLLAAAAQQASGYTPLAAPVLPIFYGPDLSGRYGGLQGLGGLEAIKPGNAAPVVFITDALGNAHNQFDTAGNTLTLTSVRPTAYGAVPGREPVPLGYGSTLLDNLAWRGRWKDITGLYWLGMRYYEPESGRWLSFDPVWNVADASGYSFCGGDPINRFDADGRLAKGVAGGYLQGDYYEAANTAQMAGQFVGQVAAGLTPYWGQAADVRDTTAAVNAIRNEGLGWGTGLGMAAAVAAWLPGAGDAVKGIVKPVVRWIDDVPAGSFTPSGGSSFQPITDPSRLLPEPQQPALLPAPHGPNPWTGEIVSWITPHPIHVERFAGNPRSPWVQPEGAGGTPSTLSIHPSNPADRLSKSVIPPGTRIQTGIAAPVPEWGGVGGAQQILILDNNVWQNQMIWEVKRR